MVTLKVNTEGYGSNKNKGIAEFKCPLCLSADVLFMKMPTICWSCGEKYLFDFSSLILYQEERVHFHFNKGATSKSHG
jgi:hypothetical protein